MIDWLRDERPNGKVLIETTKEDLPCLVFPILEELDCVEHLFTTRLGGVSKGDCATLNFSYSRGDDPEAVLENYRRVAKALHTDVKHIVATKQTHTTNLRVVTEADMGKGVVAEADYDGIDGLVTNVPGIVLAAFTADCVPIYFVDPVHKAIGLAHSGWRGTVAGISLNVLKQMKELYCSNPEDIICAIGPSICQSCYEVSEEVAIQFEEVFVDSEKYYQMINNNCLYNMGENGQRRIVEKGRMPGKYQLDLWLANAVHLLKAGILPKHLQITDLCTCDNPQYLFSHRASHGKRGNLGAFLMLR